MLKQLIYQTLERYYGSPTVQIENILYNLHGRKCWLDKIIRRIRFFKRFPNRVNLNPITHKTIYPHIHSKQRRSPVAFYNVKVGSRKEWPIRHAVWYCISFKVFEINNTFIWGGLVILDNYFTNIVVMLLKKRGPGRLITSFFVDNLRSLLIYR